MDKNCSGVVLTLDNAKADYLLEATTTEKFNNGNSIIHAQFTLFSLNGDVLFHTTTRKYKNAMKDVCNAIGSGREEIRRGLVRRTVRRTENTSWREPVRLKRRRSR